MTIKGLMNRPFLPIIGKIKMGTKKVSSQGKEYPVETPYFVLDPIEEILDKNKKPIGERTNQHVKRLVDMLPDKPMELSAVFPTPDKSLIFRSQLSWWSTTSLMCSGDGEWASYNGERPVSGFNQKDMDYPKGRNRVCSFEACPQRQMGAKGCKPNILLSFFLLDYGPLGAFRISTGSARAYKNLTAAHRLLMSFAVSEGLSSIAGIPIKLYRESVGNKKGGQNYPLNFSVDMDKYEIEKAKFEKDPKSSSLWYSANPIDFRDDEDEFDPDQYPKSMHGRRQTGEPPNKPAPKKAAAAKKPAAPATTTPDYKVWVENGTVKELFKELAVLSKADLTTPRMVATARKHKSLDELKHYLANRVDMLKQTQPEV